MLASGVSSVASSAKCTYALDVDSGDTSFQSSLTSLDFRVRWMIPKVSTRWFDGDVDGFRGLSRVRGALRTKPPR